MHLWAATREDGEVPKEEVIRDGHVGAPLATRWSGGRPMTAPHRLGNREEVIAQDDVTR